MTAFTNISNALVAVGAKPFATTIQALRDNPIAIAEGDPSALVNQYAWHPFNKIIVGDGNTGRLWSESVDGSVAVVTTPDFVDGYDYGLLFDRVGHTGSGGVSHAININSFREASAAYAGVQAITSNFNTEVFTGFLELRDVRLIRRLHIFTGAGGWINNIVSGGQLSVLRDHATAQKILRCQLSMASGGFTGTGAAIYLLRRRNISA